MKVIPFVIKINYLYSLISIFKQIVQRSSVILINVRYKMRVGKIKSFRGITSKRTK